MLVLAVASCLLAFGSFGHGAAADSPAEPRQLAGAPVELYQDTNGNAAGILYDIKLWQGLDDDDQPTLRRRHLQVQKAKHRIEPPQANVEILGLQDTGTNLLVSMLLMNFGQRLRYYDWSNPQNATGNYRNGLWKHSNLRTKFEAEPQDVGVLRQQNVTALIMVREPLSWLQSMRKAPYELGYCVMWSDEPESKWLVRKCKHPHPAGFQSVVNRTNYNNMEEIWNNWTEAYVHADQLGWSSHLIIRYEDLIRDPFVELDRIAAHLGMEHSQPWGMRSNSAKSHGDSLGRRAALKKLRFKSYLDEYFPGQTTTACNLLDAELMRLHNYLDCEHILKGWPAARHEEEQDEDAVADKSTEKAAAVPTFMERSEAVERMHTQRTAKHTRGQVSAEKRKFHRRLRAPPQA